MFPVFSFGCDEAHDASLYVGEVLDQEPETTLQVIHVPYHVINIRQDVQFLSFFILNSCHWCPQACSIHLLNLIVEVVKNA